MSETTVRREIAKMRAQADAIEAKCNDATHVFESEKHRDHLRQEAKRLREQADRQEVQAREHAVREANRPQ